MTRKTEIQGENGGTCKLPGEDRGKTDDPLRMYLREIGTVPLLTPEEEAEIFKRIEKGQKSVFDALSRSPVVVGKILKYGEMLRTGELKLQDLVEFHEGELTEVDGGKTEIQKENQKMTKKTEGPIHRFAKRLGKLTQNEKGAESREPKAPRYPFEKELFTCQE